MRNATTFKVASPVIDCSDDALMFLLFMARESVCVRRAASLTSQLHGTCYGGDTVKQGMHSNAIRMDL